eukprot:TRINITY_DN711_c0_g1_i2.p1 TRINITY_DN711_c0_g1~~TRINITY_DN711_c0_g1_i2.p1  ORF type:complete len:329 (+),score=0.56 TRINITY_DN711_c0_g1_i2:621-1607(+)
MYPDQMMPGTPWHTKFPANHQAQKDREACMKHPEQFNYTTDLFESSALAFLHRHGASQRVIEASSPFFLFLAYTVPHAGGWSDDGKESGNPVPTDGSYARHEDWPAVERDHASSVSYMDASIGRVLATLDSAGLRNNTIVVFASDNGPHNEGGHSHTFFNSSGGLRGFKRSLYEGGVRSPSIVRWPGVVQEGSINDGVWALWDLFSTFAELAGVKHLTPADSDSMSIVPLLHGDTGTKCDGVDCDSGRKHVFFTWDGGFGIRHGRWKGVVHKCHTDKATLADGALMEVYDLTVDPFEENNVAKGNTAVVEHLIKLAVDDAASCVCYQC